MTYIVPPEIDLPSVLAMFGRFEELQKLSIFKAPKETTASILFLFLSLQYISAISPTKYQTLCISFLVIGLVRKKKNNTYLSSQIKIYTSQVRWPRWLGKEASPFYPSNLDLKNIFKMDSQIFEGRTQPDKKVSVPVLKKILNFWTLLWQKHNISAKPLH